jgi:hypothetical protein
VPHREGLHRKSAIPFARTFAIVIGLHALGGAGLLLLARTEAGRELLETYNVKIAEVKPPEAEEAPVEEPPEPPPLEKLETPELPKAAQAEVAIPQGAAPQIQAAIGGGINWNAAGGFLGADLDSPEGIFHTRVQAGLRECMGDAEPTPQTSLAQFELRVGPQGSIAGYRLVRSSGDPASDRRLGEAMDCVKRKGLGELPTQDSQGRLVSVQFMPY